MKSGVVHAPLEAPLAEAEIAAFVAGLQYGDVFDVVFVDAETHSVEELTATVVRRPAQEATNVCIRFKGDSGIYVFPPPEHVDVFALQIVHSAANPRNNNNVHAHRREDGHSSGSEEADIGDSGPQFQLNRLLAASARPPTASNVRRRKNVSERAPPAAGRRGPQLPPYDGGHRGPPIPLSPTHAAAVASMSSAGFGIFLDDNPALLVRGETVAERRENAMAQRNVDTKNTARAGAADGGKAAFMRQRLEAHTLAHGLAARRASGPPSQWTAKATKVKGFVLIVLLFVAFHTRPFWMPLVVAAAPPMVADLSR